MTWNYVLPVLWLLPPLLGWLFITLACGYVEVCLSSLASCNWCFQASYYYLYFYPETHYTIGFALLRPRSLSPISISPVSLPFQTQRLTFPPISMTLLHLDLTLLSWILGLLLPRSPLIMTFQRKLLFPGGLGEILAYELEPYSLGYLTKIGQSSWHQWEECKWKQRRKKFHQNLRAKHNDYYENGISVDKNRTAASKAETLPSSSLYWQTG